ncbi:MAG: hypothetical protein Q9208_003725 [Pyrenodesmia sp. 3 TL-2023]
MADPNRGPASGKKRKLSPDVANSSLPPRNAKRVRMNKMKDARTILSQASDKALNQNGDLDVSAFVKAREFEIRAMEASMGESKNALSSRAFQQVPNELRRRTASHNVKKVPKKLRSRAARELGMRSVALGLHFFASVKMKEDNTPTVTSRRRKPTSHMRLRLETAKKLQQLHARQKKRHAAAKGKQSDGGKDTDKVTASITPAKRLKKNTLAKPNEPPSKFRKRQKHKSWLPTHVYHAKRAHMTEPKHPLWRFAIPLSPTEKTFRKTHRAGSLRGCVGWDTSYMSTIGLEGVEASLLGLLCGIGVDEDAVSGKKMAKWRRGTRSWRGWVRERDNEQKWIARIGVVWCLQKEKSTRVEDLPSDKKVKRKCFLRVHPSAFLQLWTEVMKVAKIQRPQVMVEDLRFEIGSIDVTGPGSTEALIGALQPCTKARKNATEDVAATIWSSLGSVTNPSGLPLNAILAFDASDPRLHYPPRKIQSPPSESANDDLLQILATWPPDATQTSPSIFDRTARLTASRLLPSQKAINRRKGDAMPGHYPSPAPNDPQIPIMLMASRSPHASGQGTWTLLLPWKCVLPVWYHIMHHPLSTGGNPRFGGLEEIRQIAFEQGTPWFPGDFPGTQAGWVWEMMERAKRKADWDKRPTGKRVAWESLELGKGEKGELGMGWACDWGYLYKPPETTEPVRPSQATTTDSSIKDDETSKATGAAPETPKQTADQTLPPSLHHIPLPESDLRLNSPASLPRDSQALTTIHITLLSRGSPTTCARLYRLPTTSPELRAQWLALAYSILHPPKKQPRRPNPNLDRRKILASLPQNESHPLRTQQTALSLLAPPSASGTFGEEDGKIIQPGSTDYPSVPDRDDLIGFVTTGNFDLGQGKASAIGCIALEKVVQQEEQQQAEGTEKMAADRAAGGLTNDEAKQKVVDLEKKLGAKIVGRFCIVRDAGQSVGRLGRWELA